jgi:alcohol dehydrogenase
VFHQLVIFIRRYVNLLLKIPMPTLMSGQGELKCCPHLLKQNNSTNVFIVTDKTLSKLGITKQLTDYLDAEQLNYNVFDDVTPDPTIVLIEKGVNQYKLHCTKAIAACVVKNKKITQLSGLFRIRKKLPPFIAIPTTAGTGSEATLVAVVTDPIKKQKFAVVDPCLVPQFAIIDPLLMVGLPAKITAETGIDALTHAVESYIGLHATEQTKTYSIDAIKRIFKYLPLAYKNGDDLIARTEMSLASYFAGVAFTRTSIGYVHAIAHQLGGYYHIPHGLANAVLLPHVLEFSYDSAYKKYAEIAYKVGLVNNDENEMVAANKFVATIKALNTTLNIQQSFPELKENDISLLAKRAINEAYCEYPVPKQMSFGECEIVLRKLI